MKDALHTSRMGALSRSPKRVLVTGANSYIGTSFQDWVGRFPGMYRVDTVDVRSDTWKEASFLGYNTILHVAAIVHSKEKDISVYRKANSDLPLAIAEKAKGDGVGQLIFLSTMGVYGMDVGHITQETVPDPRTPYAISKLDAEEKLRSMSSDDFRVAVLRPPIVYGKGCKGNYPRLARLAKRLPVFPKVSNQRSMIYIDNLSECIRILIDEEGHGLFFPQNERYVDTLELVKLVAKVHGNKLCLTPVPNWCMTIGLELSTSFRKVFGSLTYDRAMVMSCDTVSFEDSILQTERP